MSPNRRPSHAQRHAHRHAPGAASTPVATAADTDTEATLELPAPEDHELIEGPSREDMIRRRAFDLYQRNGCVDGRELDDWLAAEAELGREVMEGDSPMDGAIERE
ncbi:DUF2934 domain-containing protein [Rhizobacter sp. AJA081-3]|uniref:DUF2934 domain-containing protein n=1 Tax=Rhizobacter sp. AJA081-3 TaxID=2753607 RepID=UPI001ADF85D4|nr:DUF2934 domain-containing protein [Rhizobacter sp. AJA081-3]QTN22035.1 DUF2934 domain-containing protein [Rhizobacter sp. AJA081-3]